MRAALLPLLFIAATASAEEIVAIEGATVWTAPGQKLERATVVLRGGKIAAVGPSAAVPAGAKRVDARGMVVSAGFIDANTTVGLNEVGLESTTNDGEFKAGDEIHAAYRAIDGYNPRSVAIPVTRAGGVTSVVTVPRGALISGASAWVSLADAGSVDDVLLRAPLAMHVTLGDDALGSANGSRGRAIERVRELLDDAAAFARRRGAFENNQARKFAASRLDLEALAQVTSGKLPLMISADRASDIQAAVRLASEMKVHVIVAGGAEAWLVADALARARIPVLIDPTRNLPSSFARLRVRDDGPALLAKAGVPVALSALEDYANVRNLRQLAGIAVGNGLPWDAALAAVTRTPATMLGASDRGVIAVGAAADVVVWSGDPFELSTRAEHVYVRGVEQPLATRQTQLLGRYRKLP